MREKHIFEEVFRQLVSQPQFWVKLVVGGGLSFIPIANIFAFGYLYRFSAQLRKTGEISLPEWNDWAVLFADGLKFGLVWIFYWFLPLTLAIILSSMFLLLGLHILAYLMMSLMFFAGSILFCSALYRFQMKPHYTTLLDVGYIARMSLVCFEAYLVPILVFAGIFAIILPLYGVAFFTGFLLLIAQLNLCYRSLEFRK